MRDNREGTYQINGMKGERKKGECNCETSMRGRNTIRMRLVETRSSMNRQMQGTHEHAANKTTVVMRSIKSQ